MLEALLKKYDAPKKCEDLLKILRGKRGRRLRNVSIKLDGAQIQALRKIATLRSVPYQTLIRQFLAEAIRRELRLAG